MAEPITTAALADETHAASPDTDDDAESFRKSKAESPTVQLGGMSIADAWNEDNQIQASILMQGLKIHYGKDDQRDGLILSDDSRAKARAAAELWKDDAQRQKFLDEYSITDDKSLDDLWEATEAWLNHANNPIPEQVIQHVDEAVKKLMPPDTEILSISPHGISSWSRSACIETTLDGKSVAYFLKATPSKSGKIMFNGELESLRAIHAAMPDFCPEPIGTGVYESDPNIYFFLSGFIDMLDEPPDPNTLPEKVAELHKRAVAPDGMYGFHVPTTAGLLPVKVAKSKSWEDFFARYMRYLLLAEQLAQGPPKDKDEYDRLTELLFNRLIPRLLRPLETGGRTIEPRLLHTDIYDGNCGTDSEDGRPIVFDPCSMYGHNEFDLGVWTCPRATFGPNFMNRYHQFFKRSLPVEDYEGRHLLYLMAFEARASVTIVGNGHYRDEFLKYIDELDMLFPETYEQWAIAQGEEPEPMKSLD